MAEADVRHGPVEQFPGIGRRTWLEFRVWLLATARREPNGRERWLTRGRRQAERKDVYDDIKRTLGIDFVPNLYKLMGPNPAYLEANWRSSPSPWPPPTAATD